MSESQLSAQIAPFKLARQERILQGVVQTKGMQRLAQVLSSDCAEIVVKLQFGKDEEGVSFAQGHLSTNVELICQRCMHPMTLPINANVSLGFVRTDAQASNLSDRYDPCVINDEPVSLTEIVEDELMLALPIVAMHAENCNGQVVEKLQQETGASAQTDEKPNPFAVLSQLKRQK